MNTLENFIGCEYFGRVKFDPSVLNMAPETIKKVALPTLGKEELKVKTNSTLY